ncbi:SpoIIE family protein phosphatase [Jatrophihabitans endophyticus]|uniref:SpoIIE family protein phosphatase n=1 Tax=Jatrophihabitans endophyticus TaxID=1206085 RepID=UPI0019EB38E5|nr:SpoIIE family protein phosphatase [Jatrophihabitans endophyticus]MBE7188068.1 SpoIIE family protein phosphatase [Jatrophihabitans endophyticus]
MSEQLAQLTFDAAGVGICGIDADGTAVVANPAVAELTGWPIEHVVGRNAHDLLHRPPNSDPDDRPRQGCPILEVSRGGPTTRDDSDVFWRRDGSPLPVWWVAAPVVLPESAAGAVTAIVVFGDASERRERSRSADARLAEAESGRSTAELQRDVAERQAMVARDEVEVAQAETARLAVLARLSDLLNSLDILSGLDRVAELVVDTGLADACVIDRVTADGGVARVSLVASGLPGPAAASELHRLPSPSGTSSRSLAQVLNGADTVVVDLSAPSRGRPYADELDEVQARLFDVLGASRAMVTALAARGRVLGAMTWVRRDPRAEVSSPDLLMLRLFALRIGQWMDNLRLNDLQQAAALTLQRSLLTALPQPGGLEILGRYLPAGEGVEIGGDWYDAVLAPDGFTVVAIGDVSGHDMAAATRMAQLRSMLRFAVLRSPLDPAGVLREVDEAMPTLGVGGSATVVLGTLTVDPSAAVDERHTLIWSNAGHLPPLVLPPGGPPRLLTRPADLLLGVDPMAPRHEHRVALAPGSTLVLYTDGLVERRDETLQAGLDRLVEAARDAAGRPLTQLCDALLTVLVPAAGTDDDVAVLAVRLPADGAEGR